MVLKQVSDLLEDFLDAALLFLVRVQDFQKRVVRARIVGESSLDGRHVRNGVIKLDGLVLLRLGI